MLDLDRPMFGISVGCTTERCCTSADASDESESVNIRPPLDCAWRACANKGIVLDIWLRDLLAHFNVRRLEKHDLKSNDLHSQTRFHKCEVFIGSTPLRVNIGRRSHTLESS